MKFLNSLIFLAAFGCAGTDDGHYDLVFAGAMVLDGSGAAGFVADVAVSGDRITRIDRNGIPESTAVRVVDAEGLVLAPGFIDVHAHLDPLLAILDSPKVIGYSFQVAVGSRTHQVNSE